MFEDYIKELGKQGYTVLYSTNLDDNVLQILISKNDRCLREYISYTDIYGTNLDSDTFLKNRLRKMKEELDKNLKGEEK